MFEIEALSCGYEQGLHYKWKPVFLFSKVLNPVVRNIINQTKPTTSLLHSRKDIKIYQHRQKIKCGSNTTLTRIE